MTTAYDIWGAAALELARPEGPLSYALIALTLALLLAALYQARAVRVFRAMDRSQWVLFVALCVAAVILSQLFPLTIPWADPLLREQPVTAFLLLLSAVPWLLAGAALNVPAAIVVGLVAGSGRALAQTGAVLDIPATALAAGLAAWLMQQNYTGRAFYVLRQPVVAALAAQAIQVLFVVAGTFVATLPQTGVLAALDLALYLGIYSAAPLMIEGVVGGLLVTFILWIVPKWRPNRGLVPSPLRRSLQRQLTAAFLSFAVVVVLLSALLAFGLSQRAAGRAVAEQMAANTDAVAVRLGAFQSDLSNRLLQYAADPALADANPQTRRAALGRLQRSSLQFSQVKLVNELGVTSSDATLPTLTGSERTLAAAAVEASAPRFGTETGDNGQVVTLAVPIANSSGRQVVLLGRIAPAALAAVAADLRLTGGASSGAVVDEQARVVLGLGNLASANMWAIPRGEEAIILQPDSGSGAVYAIRDPESGARQLVYYTLVPESGWRVVSVVPQARILRQALSVMAPLAGLLLAVSTLFFVYVAGLGRAISRPIAEIGQASRAIAGGGGLERPVRTHREDEIGQLTLAFSQMQRALRQRLDELSLLLSVSNDVAATVSLSDGMTAVLQGVLRGTGAAGARAVVRNPVGSAPLVFAEGPAAESMALLDRAVVRRMRTVDELGLAAPQDVQAELETDAAPVAALFALPLRLAGEYQGALYLGYRQPHYFDSDERNLLRTLAGQASVLVQNAYLYAAAEGGRRRLMAILASTTNAVIVTDQTDRVLLLNPAMERALGLKASEIAARPVADALAGSAWDELAQQLTIVGRETLAADGKLELSAGGHDFLASISTVHNSDGLAMGRVAVLQDVSELKEVDRLKLEFIDGISHDLRSPLTYMRTYAGMLPVIDDPALEREYVGKIMVGIDRMSRLVNDLLDMTRIRAGIDLQLDRVQAGELLADVSQEYATTARMHGVRLLVDAPDSLPYVKADPVQLRRAIFNLVDNALKYAPNSGPVTLRAENRLSEVVLSVSDRGPGIPAADLPNLFQKFYRGKQTTAERARGSGLGLAIVKTIADQHGGRVWCESKPGHGSAFYLALPVENES